MRRIILLWLMFIFVETNLMLYGQSISNDSLNNKNKDYSAVFLDFGGTSRWFSINYQQNFISKGKYSLGVMTGVNNKVMFGFENFLSDYHFYGKIFQNHWYLLGSINTKKISFDLGVGIKFSYLYDGAYLSYYEFGSGALYKYSSIYPNKLETDLLFNFSFRYHISKRFFLRFSSQLKIFDISKNYTSFFNDISSGSVKRYYVNEILPLSVSIVGFTSNPSKKNSYQNIHNERKNYVFFNPLNYSFGYERRILKKDDHTVCISYQNIIIPYKRYYESYKRGLFFAPTISLTYSCSSNQAFTPVIGVSYVHVYNKFSVLNKMFYEKADYIRANLGLKVALYKNIYTKITYNPIVKIFNDNTTLNIENIEKSLSRHSDFDIYDIYIVLGYAF